MALDIHWDDVAAFITLTVGFLMVVFGKDHPFIRQWSFVIGITLMFFLTMAYRREFSRFLVVVILAAVIGNVVILVQVGLTNLYASLIMILVTLHFMVHVVLGYCAMLLVRSLIKRFYR